jgi:hypothetical protein
MVITALLPDRQRQGSWHYRQLEEDGSGSAVTAQMSSGRDCWFAYAMIIKIQGPFSIHVVGKERSRQMTSVYQSRVFCHVLMIQNRSRDSGAQFHAGGEPGSLVEWTDPAPVHLHCR